MKKVITLIIAALMCLTALCACSKTDSKLNFGKEFVPAGSQLDVLVQLNAKSVDVGIMDSIMAKYYTSQDSKYASALTVIDGVKLTTEQYGIAASVQKFFYVSVSPQCALFSGNHAPRAAIHASAGQKTYCRRIVIQPVIRAGVFDLRGQHGRIVPIPSSALYYLAGESVRIIGCECKYFGHIHPVVLPEHGVGKLHAVAVRFVSCRKFHQGEVREVVAVYVYQSYLHGLLL